MTIVLMSPAAEAAMNARRRKEDAQVCLLIYREAKADPSRRSNADHYLNSAIQSTVAALSWGRVARQYGGPAQ